MVKAVTTTGNGRTATREFHDRAVALRTDVKKLGTIANRMARREYAEARHDAALMMRRGRKKLHEFERAIEKPIRAHPMRAVFIAAGTGLLVGMLLRRRYH